MKLIFGSIAEISVNRFPSCALLQNLDFRWSGWADRIKFPLVDPIWSGNPHRRPSPVSLSALSQVTCRLRPETFNWHLCCSTTERVDPEWIPNILLASG